MPSSLIPLLMSTCLILGEFPFLCDNMLLQCTQSKLTCVLLFRFPPRLFHILADMFNNSSSQYLICYHGPRLMIDRYEFNVELLAQTSTSMHGSSEVHSGYIYKRTNSNKSKCKSKTFGEACDPLFAEAWKICRSGLDEVLKHTEDQVNEHIKATNQRVTRAAAKRASSTD
jgi:hypothetical protein